MHVTGGFTLALMGHAVVQGPDGTQVPVRSGQVAVILALLWDTKVPVRREDVAELLWGTDRFPDHWAGAVRGVVAKARQVLERAGLPPGLLRAESGLIELALPDGSTTDVDHATALVARAEVALEQGQFDVASECAENAIAIVARPLAISGEGDWMRHLHDRVTSCAQRARQIAAEALLGADRGGDAAAQCKAAIIADPFDEISYGLLIRAHLIAGQPTAAQRAYDELVHTLATELGVSPSAAVTNLLPAARGAEPKTSPRQRANLGFRGRKHELATLRACLDDTVATGRPALVLIEGPSGIGKTRLAQVFAESSGVAFGWGRCHRRAAIPFEPFVDAIRARLSQDAAGVLPAAQRSALERLDFDTPPTRTGGAPLGDDRDVVLRDLVTAIAEWANGDPLVLVLDDFQWASGDTIALAQRVLENAQAAILMVATVRGQATDPLAVADLMRSAPTTVIALAGITASELMPLAEELTADLGTDDDAEEFARALHARTGGLAYYIDELTRAYQRGGRLDPDEIPASARTWIRNRIDGLPASQTALLETAAIIAGEEAVGLGLIAAIVNDAIDVVADLDALARDGLLVSAEPGGTFHFAHEITREVVIERIGAARQAQLHLAVAQELCGHDDPPHAALARHFQAAGREYFHDAARHGQHAAVSSLTRGAWDLADTQADAALRCCPGQAVMLRAALFCIRGSARHALGRAAEAVGDFNEAIGLSTEHQLPHHLARATLRLVGRAGRGAAPDMADTRRISLLRRALEGIRTWDAPSDAPDMPGFAVDATARADLQTALEVELAWATLFIGTFDDRRALLTESLDRARREPTTLARLARILVAQRNILQGPGDFAERVATTDEALSLPATHIPAEILIAAHLGRHEDLLSCGDFAAAAEALAAATELVARHGHPYWRWAVATWRSLALLVAGDPSGAEVALAAASGIQSMASPEITACTAVQTVAIRLAQNRAHEVVDMLAASATLHPEIPCYRAVLALCLSHADDAQGATRAFAEFARDDFASIPIDSNRLLTVAVLGDVAADLGDAQSATTLHRMLGPDADLNVVLNCYGGGGAWWGPVARIRERLADVAGRVAADR